MRKVFEYIGLITLMCFSFFLTEKTSTIAKNTDEIMLTIKEEYQKYEKLPINATIKDNTIIPGICGKKVHINNSYREMHKVGIYDENLYQFTDVQPQISIIDNYDKLIISDNDQNSNIYLFFSLNKNNIDLIDSITFKNCNFIVDATTYQKYNSTIIKLSKDNSILISPTNFKNYKKIAQNYYDIKHTKIYCYNDKDETFLNSCSSNKSMTISINKYIDNNFLLNIKKNLKAGQFLKLELNEDFINNYHMIKNYLESKGLNISQIDLHLSKC